MNSMRFTFLASLVGVTVVAGALGLAIAAPAKPAPASPPPAKESPRLPRKLAAAEIKISKADVLSIVDRATGPIVVDCKGAQTAAAAYETCKDNCATAAQTAPITPAELEKCGNQSAADCASLLISSRARECINAPAPVGCRDAYAKLQAENTECKNCGALKTATETAVDAVKAQAKVVAQAEMALAQARAQLDAKEARASALAAKTAKVCAAARQ